MFDTPMTQRQLEYLKKVHLPVIKEHHVTQLHYDKMMSYLLEAMRGNGAQVGWTFGGTCDSFLGGHGSTCVVVAGAPSSGSGTDAKSRNSVWVCSLPVALMQANALMFVQDDHLRLVMAKLQPLKDLFPSDDGSVSHGSVDGTMVLQDYRHHHPQQSSSAADSLTTDSLRTGDSTNSSFTALTGPATASASACPFVATQSAATGSGKGDHQQQQDTATGCTDKRNISWLRRLFSCVQRD